MRRLLFCAALTMTLTTNAKAQPFEVDAGFQFVNVSERIIDPEFCEGIEFFTGQSARDLDPLGAGLAHRFRCGGQRTEVFVRLDSDASPGRLAGRMEGLCEITSEVPVTLGRCEANLMGWYEARLSTTGWRQFHLAGRIDVQAAILPGEGELDFGYATISIERGRIGGLDEIIFAEVVSVEQPGERIIDAIVNVPPGESTVFMGLEQFGVEQNSERQNGSERIAAQLEFEMRVIPCSADINWDNRVDIEDLGILLSHLYHVESRESGDLNGDGLVDLSDLAILLAAFGDACQY